MFGLPPALACLQASSYPVMQASLTGSGKDLASLVCCHLAEMGGGLFLSICALPSGVFVPSQLPSHPVVLPWIALWVLLLHA
jgi:hypothetical protein